MARRHDAAELCWVDPECRGILPLDTFHLPRSLRKVIRQQRFAVRCDTAFDTVMKMCAAPTDQRPDTWINQEILRLFSALHEVGMAHSIECWSGSELAGGLYGLSLGGAFFGESMFCRQTDASKVALAHLVARLKKGAYTLLDTQFLTEHLAQFGAIEVPRQDYLRLLARAIEHPARFYGELGDGEALELLSAQSITQTS
jgi:leucyl/phenylalanyl-tRNA--protein transferase